ncbi:MAG: transporter substrate-binding domain-containing protein [Novosphingobium sp.]|nr:transporter substrate-binding domain-containing protein [Novosphingobium sp.]
MTFTSQIKACHQLAIGCAVILAALIAAPLAAQEAGPSGEMVIATREAPPFAMKGADGKWEGIAIDLWRAVAAERGYGYRFEEADLTGMIDGVAEGKYAASVGALTITPDREEKVDFSHPFYETGFGIATRKSSPQWLTLITNFFTWQFFQAVMALGIVLLIVGFLFWLAERKHNSEEFGQGIQGLGSGFWFSAVTMTTVGYGDKAPRTPMGKAIALVWMFAAILIISTFTGMIASSLTAGKLEGAIAGPNDLDDFKVGSIAGSASDNWLGKERISFKDFADVKTGLAALEAGRIDAFVYDAPLLQYLVLADGSEDLEMVPGSFGRQDYGIALPSGSELRDAINVSLLRHVESEDWRRSIEEYLGESD